MTIICYQTTTWRSIQTISSSLSLLFTNFVPLNNHEDEISGLIHMLEVHKNGDGRRDFLYKHLIPLHAESAQDMRHMFERLPCNCMCCIVKKVFTAIEAIKLLRTLWCSGGCFMLVHKKSLR